MIMPSRPNNKKHETKSFALHWPLFPWMGNAVVIPSFNDWYIQPLKKLGVKIKRHLDSGTFFMVFEGQFQDKDVIIKAYQYPQPLESLHEVKTADEYFKLLGSNQKNIHGLVPYKIISLQETQVFLIRDKLQNNLFELVEYQQPPLDVSEKLWIAFQIVNDILLLHKKTLNHGDLKPFNIFISQGLRTVLTDPAPFKPQFVNPRRPHLYYHFFTINPNSGCYLAPERVSLTENHEKIDMMAADLFSLGCVLAYLYLDGKELFDLSKISEYAQGKYDISESLEKIENKAMAEFIKCLLDVDPTKRKDALNLMQTLFPPMFTYFYNIYFMIEPKFSNRADYVQFSEIVKISGDEFRLILYDFLMDQVYKMTSVDCILYSIDFLVDFTIPLPDEQKLSRVIPFFITLLNRDSPIIVRSALTAITSIFQSIHEIPDSLTGYVRCYLTTELKNVVNFCFDEHEQIAFAEYLPFIAAKIKNISHDDLQAFPLAFSSLFATTNPKIFKAFSDSMQMIAEDGGFPVLQSFFYVILTTFNHTDELFKIEIIKIIKAFYEHGEHSEFLHFIEQGFNSAIPICYDICSRDPSPSLLADIYELVKWAFDHQMIDESYAYDFFPFVQNSLNHTDANLRYQASKLVESMPKFVDDDILLGFAYGERKSSRNLEPIASHVKNHVYSSSKKFPLVESVANIKFDPHFVASSHFSQSTVTSIIPGFDDETFIYVDEKNVIRFVSLPNQKDLVPTVIETIACSKKITSIATVKEDKAYAIGFEDGTIEYHMNQNKKLIREKPGPVTAMLQVFEYTLMIGSANGDIEILDSRKEEPIASMRFEYSGISDFTIYSSNEQIIGIGLTNGFVSLFDLRIMKPIWFAATKPVRQMIPVACPHDNSASIVIISNDEVEVLQEPSHSYSYYLKNKTRAGIPFMGGAILLDDYSANFIDIKNKLFIRLYDRGTEHITPTVGKLLDTKLVDKETQLRSVHMNPGKIQCVAQCGNLILSGDNYGFINIWSPTQ